MTGVLPVIICVCGRTIYRDGPWDRNHNLCSGDFNLRRSHVDVRSNKRVARQNVADREYQPKVSEMSEGNGRLSGTVKFFNPDKGYGFIRRDGGQDVFIHANELRKSGIVDLSPVITGAKMEFNTEIAEKGPKATNIRMIPEVPASSAAAL